MNQLNQLTQRCSAKIWRVGLVRLVEEFRLRSSSAVAEITKSECERLGRTVLATSRTVATY
jgi:hypothetical protein